MISVSNAPRPPHPKTPIWVENTTEDYWTRKISTSSLTGKSLDRLFCRFLMNQRIGLDSIYLPWKENQVADETSHLTKENLTSVKSLLQGHPLLSSYHRYHPSPEISSRIFNLLIAASEALLVSLRLHGRFTLVCTTVWSDTTTCS